MTLPGTLITERERTTSRTAPTDTGVAFVVGATDKGPTDAPRLVTSMSAFRAIYGDDVAYSYVSSAVQTAFTNGLAKVYVLRVVGAAAVKASVTLKDASDVDAGTVTARDPGPHANGWTVTVTAGSGAGTFVLALKDADGAALATSPDLADGAAAATWAAGTGLVTYTALAGADPKPVSNAALAGGADDRASINSTTRSAALPLFTRDLGPGQVYAPGATAIEDHTALLTHARDYNRRAILDLPDTSDVSTLKTAAAAVRALGALARYGAAFAPYAVIPGLVPGTTRRVPWGSVVLGHVARNDALFGHANVPAAGKNGVAKVLGVSAVFTDAEREELNDAGVNVALVKNGQPRTYGFRTLAPKDTDDLYWQFANVRLDMEVRARGDVIAEDEVFAVIDGEGLEAAHYGGRLAAMLADYYRRHAIYGSTADDAFSVDVGPAVNTPESIADGRLRAVLAYRRSPMAERVELEIVHVALSEAV